MKNIILSLTISCSFFTGFSQREGDKAISQLKKLCETYRSIPFLSFDMQYLYADEKTPSVYSDSLDGSFNLNGSRCHYTIAKTEVVYGSEQAIIFYKEDSVIYITKPSQPMMNNPIVMLDSLLCNQDIELSMQDLKSSTLLTIKPKDTSLFKEMIYEINKGSGLVDRLTQVVNGKYMFEHVETPDKGKTQYAIVTTKFKNYSTRPFDTSIFDISNYVKIEDGRYVPVKPFESYQVFNANPQL